MTDPEMQEYVPRQPFLPACCLIAMLLYMSSGRIEYLGRLLDGREDFSSNIAFETADDVALAHSLRGSTTHICLGAQLVTQPDDDYAIERRIGLAVTSAVEPMLVRLARCAGIGFTPHSDAKAASDRSRSGLLPAAISRDAAV